MLKAIFTYVTQSYIFWDENKIVFLNLKQYRGHKLLTTYQ